MHAALPGHPPLRRPRVRTVRVATLAILAAASLLTYSTVRAQGASRIGVYGLSLGGYNAALLSSLDELVRMLEAAQ